MRIAVHQGGVLLLINDTPGIDAAVASGGRFGPAPAAIYESWPDFSAWVKELDISALTTVSVDQRALDCPSPQARQVFGIGLNYKQHAAESGYPLPDVPPVFTKFPTSLAAPYSQVTLPAGGNTDWEAELVVIIGRIGHRIPEARAWSHVAGVCIGQDLSERILQMADPTKQFSLGKSYPGFGPFGPWLVTPDELDDPDNIGIGCSVDGEVMQAARTNDLIFPIPVLIAHLSQTITLLPGDVIFTGTPGGVGLGMSPARYLAPGQTLVTWAEGIGRIEQTCVAQRE